MRTFGRVLTGLLSVCFFLLRTVIYAAAAWLVCIAAFWVSPWLGWPVAVITCLLVGLQLLGSFLALPLMFATAFTREETFAEKVDREVEGIKSEDPTGLRTSAELFGTNVQVRGGSDEQILAAAAAAAEEWMREEDAKAER